MPVKAADSREVLTMQKILVVDDEARMRNLVHDFLIRAGYEVMEAGDGLEAVDIFEQQPDIALMTDPQLNAEIKEANGYRPPQTKNGAARRRAVFRNAQPHLQAL